MIEPEPDGTFRCRLVPPECPLPDTALFMLADPADSARMIVALFADGSVAFGDGITPDTAAEAFWTALRPLVYADL